MLHCHCICTKLLRRTFEISVHVNKYRIIGNYSICVTIKFLSEARMYGYKNRRAMKTRMGVQDKWAWASRQIQERVSNGLMEVGTDRTTVM